MNELKKWWAELDSDDRFIMVLVAMVCVSIVALIQPVVPILIIFFTGMYFTIHAPDRNNAKLLDIMKAKMEAGIEKRPPKS